VFQDPRRRGNQPTNCGVMIQRPGNNGGHPVEKAFICQAPRPHSLRGCESMALAVRYFLVASVTSVSSFSLFVRAKATGVPSFPEASKKRVWSSGKELSVPCAAQTPPFAWVTFLNDPRWLVPVVARGGGHEMAAKLNSASSYAAQGVARSCQQTRTGKAGR
jgi:hypothetical protein